MSELKTLKDLDFIKSMHYKDDEIEYNHPIEFDMEDVKELREEAIKWFKYTFVGENGEENRMIIGARLWIKHFFNITDEELK